MLVYTVSPVHQSDVGQKFCCFSSPAEGDCESIARYGVRGSKTREFCSRHAPEGMVNMNDRLCIHGDCPKLPTYGQKGTKVRGRIVVEVAGRGRGVSPTNETVFCVWWLVVYPSSQQ